MRKWLPASLAALAVLATAVVHGVWTGRWQEAAAAPATANLQQIPLRLGEWRGQLLDLNVREAADYSAVLYRRYVHERTGAVVSVVLVAGRPGPVSIHAPDYCYPASGYDKAFWLPYKLTLDNNRPPAEFMTGQLTKTQAAGQSHLRVFWSWYAGGAWSVPDNPRWTFAGQNCLYKIHVVRETLSTGEGLDNDPCVDLLRLFLAAFQRQVAGTDS
jgi:hypothetical protein